MSSDRDRLAADLHTVDPDYSLSHERLADCLIALGWTRLQPGSPAADNGVSCDWDENGYCRCTLDEERLIDTIEAEALAAERARIRAAVDGLPIWLPGTQSPRLHGSPEADDYWREVVALPAVLAIIDGDAG